MNQDKRQIAEQYVPLFDGISAILFCHDPIGISAENNRDEYNPEARTILKRLYPDIDADELRRVIHQEFERWFGVETAGNVFRYNGAAADILEAYKKAGTPAIE